MINYNNYKRGSKLVLSCFKNIANQNYILAVFEAQEKELAESVYKLLENKEKWLSLDYWTPEEIRYNMFPTEEEWEEQSYIANID